jgi:endonuclease/exonuclease/phosphatase (EEP) superfamily protein YafD
MARHRLHSIALALLLPVLSGCITLTSNPRGVFVGASGTTEIAWLKCDAAAKLLPPGTGGVPGNALDSDAFRVTTWNLHKEVDLGWEQDLARIASLDDLLLMQEAALGPPLSSLLALADMRWVMASSFLYNGQDVGVMTASRSPPIASCIQRAVEPYLGIPKSAVISWFPLAGRSDALAVINIHAINFDLALANYRAQLVALTNVLADHQGPIIFAGDFNTWSAARETTVAEVLTPLGLFEVRLPSDERSLFFGRHLDHVYVRGLEYSEARALVVRSSDHNPVTVIFRVPR